MLTMALVKGTQMMKSRILIGQSSAKCDLTNNFLSRFFEKLVVPYLYSVINKMNQKVNADLQVHNFKKSLLFTLLSDSLHRYST